MDLIIPRKLSAGDKIAAVSLSWGGPGAMPHRYQAGKQQLQKEFEVDVVESRHALKSPEWLARNPQARAEDLMECYSDSSIKAIFSTIGGEDSVRLLPWLDLNVIKNNPKVLLGYSDTTINHIASLQAGVRSYYGPSLMSGFAENCGMFPYMVEAVRRTLFNTEPIGEVSGSQEGWTVEFLDWSRKENQTRLRHRNPMMPWKFLQGAKVTTGHLIGGCADVLEFLKGTDFWPEKNCWEGAILFLETSEDAVSPAQFRYWLRNYASMGILQQINGILFGRPGGNIPIAQFDEYDEALVQVVVHEVGRPDLPIITRLDFGHTDPMFVIPYGAQAQIDPVRQTFEITESGVI